MVTLSILFLSCTSPELKKEAKVFKDVLKQLDEDIYDEEESTRAINRANFSQIDENQQLEVRLTQESAVISEADIAQSALQELLNNPPRSARSFLRTALSAVQNGANPLTRSSFSSEDNILTHILKQDINGRSFISNLKRFIQSNPKIMNSSNGMDEKAIEIAATRRNPAAFDLLLRHGAVISDKAYLLAHQNQSNRMINYLGREAQNYLSRTNSSVYQYIFPLSLIEESIIQSLKNRNIPSVILHFNRNRGLMTDFYKNRINVEEHNILRWIMENWRDFRGFETDIMRIISDEVSPELLATIEGDKKSSVYHAIRLGIAPLFSSMMDSIIQANRSGNIHIPFDKAIRSNAIAAFHSAVAQSNAPLIVEKIVDLQESARINIAPGYSYPIILEKRGKAWRDRSGNHSITSLKGHSINIMHHIAFHGTHRLVYQIIDQVGRAHANLRSEASANANSGFNAITPFEVAIKGHGRGHALVARYMIERLEIDNGVKLLATSSLTTEGLPRGNHHALRTAIDMGLNKDINTYFLGGPLFVMACGTLNPSLIRVALSSDHIKWKDSYKITYAGSDVVIDFFNMFVLSAFGILRDDINSINNRNFSSISRILDSDNFNFVDNNLGVSDGRYFGCLRQIVSAIRRNNITEFVGDRRFGSAINVLYDISNGNHELLSLLSGRKTYRFTGNEMYHLLTQSGNLTEAKKFEAYKSDESSENSISEIKNRASERAALLAHRSLSIINER